MKYWKLVWYGGWSNCISFITIGQDMKEEETTLSDWCQFPFINHFPNVVYVYCLSAIKQRPKSSAKCTLFQGKKNLMLVDWKQQKFSCWRELKSINFLCKFHFMKQTLTIYNFHMKYLSFSNRLCNFSKSNQTVNYKLKDSWKGPGTVVNLSETC